MQDAANAAKMPGFARGSGGARFESPWYCWSLCCRRPRLPSHRILSRGSHMTRVVRENVFAAASTTGQRWRDVYDLGDRLWPWLRPTGYSAFHVAMPTASRTRVRCLHGSAFSGSGGRRRPSPPVGTHPGSRPRRSGSTPGRHPRPERPGSQDAGAADRMRRGRGYLAGSGWKEYQQSQSICGVKLPAGLASATSCRYLHPCDEGRLRA